VTFALLLSNIAKMFFKEVHSGAHFVEKLSFLALDISDTRPFSNANVNTML
jgi:hypothetical protein